MNSVVEERNSHCAQWLILALLCLLAFSPCTARATTYCVDAEHPDARNSNPGTLTLQPFESNVMIAAVDALVPCQATLPVPPDGGQPGVPPVLQWTPTAEAAFHDVYIGEEESAVEAADVTSLLCRKRQISTSFSLHGLVAPGSRCFWRVDEVEDDYTTIHRGVVWVCTVPQYLMVDDFERYTDKKGNRLKSFLGDTWADGAGNGTGAQVGLRSNPRAPGTDNTHGQKSIFLAYDNTRPPFLSEAEREFSPSQDWTAGGMDTLSLWLQGDVASFGETTPGTFIMSAVGSDIWASQDEFRYAYQRLDGDGAIVARVERVAETDFWAKAGVMIRESLDPASAHVSMFVIPSGIRAFQNRPANYASQCFSAHSWSDLEIPSWIKLEREGRQFTGYHSPDGVNWTRVSATGNPDPDNSANPQIIDMPQSVYIGLALTSHASGVVTTATFSDVQIMGTVTGPWQVAGIGVGQPGNSPDDLYVTVEDSEGEAATVVNPDPAAVNVMAWTQWRIPLSDFVGVDLSRVRRLGIGVAGRDALAPSGDGRVYIDDFWVWKP